MKQCQKCNISNEDHKTVCSYCGSPLDNAETFVNEASMYGHQTLFNEQPRTNGFAIASMILGIASIPLICACCAGFITGILAIIFGFIARNKIRASLGAEKGEGMALAGIILGFSAIGLCIILILISVASPEYSKDFWDGFEQGLHKNGYKEY